MMSEPDDEQSVTAVIALLMLTIAALGWGFCAAVYAGDTKDWVGRGTDVAHSIGPFITNGFAQLPNFPSVVAHSFTKRIWLPSIFIGLEVVALLLGYKMRSLEREMASPKKRPRSSSRR